MGMILAACGGGLSEDDAEDALRAAFEGDVQKANEHFCNSDRMPLDEELLPASVVFKEVTCEQRGADQMTCTTTFDKDGSEDRIIMIFKVWDDHLCDAQIQ